MRLFLVVAAALIAFTGSAHSEDVIGRMRGCIATLFCQIGEACTNQMEENEPQVGFIVLPNEEDADPAVIAFNGNSELFLVQADQDLNELTWKTANSTNVMFVGEAFFYGNASEFIWFFIPVQLGIQSSSDLRVLTMFGSCEGNN